MLCKLWLLVVCFPSASSDTLVLRLLLAQVKQIRHLSDEGEKRRRRCQMMSPALHDAGSDLTFKRLC